MALWGKWFAADIKQQLAASLGEHPEPRDPSPNSEAAGVGFEAHAWLRTCGYACGVLPEACEKGAGRKGRKEGKELPAVRPLQPCGSWLHHSTW